MDSQEVGNTRPRKRPRSSSPPAPEELSTSRPRRLTDSDIVSCSNTRTPCLSVSGVSAPYQSQRCRTTLNESEAAPASNEMNKRKHGCIVENAEESNVRRELLNGLDGESEQAVKHSSGVRDSADKRSSDLNIEKDEKVSRRDVDMESSSLRNGDGKDHVLGFARGCDLQFHQVQASNGAVFVAVALAVNNSYSGVLKVPPRTDTGSQRAFKGDEFFFVRSGRVFLDITDQRHALHTGDHIVVPHMSSYSFHNFTTSECELVFFVPQNPYG